MKHPDPTKPDNLHPLAAAILDALAKIESSSSIIIGGGVALQHYCNARETQDIDAWWADAPNKDAQKTIDTAMRSVAGKSGLELSTREWGETASYDLCDGNRKVFSFRISIRDKQLDPALPSSWWPVGIESFRDNLGAKMNALVSRGAPRDFVDICEICARELATVSDCWALWQEKNPGKSPEQAKANAIRHLKRIEERRPLADMPEAERDLASNRRTWIEKTLCKGPKDGFEPGS